MNARLSGNWSLPFKDPVGASPAKTNETNTAITSKLAVFSLIFGTIPGGRRCNKWADRQEGHRRTLQENRSKLQNVFASLKRHETSLQLSAQEKFHYSLLELGSIHCFPSHISALLKLKRPVLHGVVRCTTIKVPRARASHILLLAEFIELTQFNDRNISYLTSPPVVVDSLFLTRSLIYGSAAAKLSASVCVFKAKAINRSNPFSCL